jgi:hypothetical protein
MLGKPGGTQYGESSARPQFQPTVTVACPGSVIEIVPDQLHEHVESLVRAGWFPIKVLDAPGDHGAVVIGMHGIGVSTPSAAAVAAATIGFAVDWHIPNGRILTMGT